MKIGKSQEKLFVKDEGNGGENNNGVGDGIGDIYKHDQQQLTLSPNLFEINSCWDKRHEEIASWITWIAGSKIQDVDKSLRQKINIL